MSDSFRLTLPKLRSQGIGMSKSSTHQSILERPGKGEWELMRRDTLPTDWQSALLRLLLQTLSFSLSPSNPRTHQGGNGIVVRKLFGSVCPSLAPSSCS